MKHRKLAVLSVMNLLAMSACLQAESTLSTAARAQTAGPTIVSKGSSDSKYSPSCDETVDKKNALSEVNEGADALFQILTTDPNDLTTVHNRAQALLDLENDYSRNFIEPCTKEGQGDAATALKFEKLAALVKETDATVIHALAKDLWDLFNPNISISSDGGVSSPNPFAAPADSGNSGGPEGPAQPADPAVPAESANS